MSARDEEKLHAVMKQAGTGADSAIRYLCIDVANGYVETEPGILNTELREHVAREGLWYAPDPASKDFCSIGGKSTRTRAGSAA